MQKNLIFVPFHYHFWVGLCTLHQIHQKILCTGQTPPPLSGNAGILEAPNIATPPYLLPYYNSARTQILPAQYFSTGDPYKTHRQDVRSFIQGGGTSSDTLTFSILISGEHQIKTSPQAERHQPPLLITSLAISTSLTFITK